MTGSGVLPFNPLDKKHLGETVAQALLRKPVEPLASVEKFRGAGIYAIYYTGQFPAYEPMAKANRDGRFLAPIYAGKAIPKGGRKGGAPSATTTSTALFTRLTKHAASVKQAENLDLDDFHCRYLVVDDIWIPLGEHLLIAKFTPLWNHLVDGFGNHDPGKGRYGGLRPRWDVLHPGRPWADKCKAREETAEQIEREIIEHLRTNPPPKDPVIISAPEG